MFLLIIISDNSLLPPHSAYVPVGGAECGLTVIADCDSDDELDFLFPQITRIHNHDLAALDIWLNQIEWTKALPPSELKQLQSADFSKSNLAVIGDKNSATTA